MSKIKKSKIIRITTNSREYKILTTIDGDPYWDEGIRMYPNHNRGTKCSNKRIFNFQRRMYKTWKHNRKHQWKN